MLFLNENKGKPRDVFYAVCFVFCIAPIGYSPVSILGDATVPYAYSLNVLVMSLALMALTGFLALETWITRITEVFCLEGVSKHDRGFKGIICIPPDDIQSGKKICVADIRVPYWDLCGHLSIRCYRWGVYTLVFSIILRNDIDKYYLFLFVALVPWIFFSASLTGGADSVLASKDMLKRYIFQERFYRSPMSRELLSICF